MPDIRSERRWVFCASGLSSVAAEREARTRARGVLASIDERVIANDGVECCGLGLQGRGGIGPEAARSVPCGSGVEQTDVTDRPGTETSHHAEQVLGGRAHLIGPT